MDSNLPDHSEDEPLSHPASLEPEALLQDCNIELTRRKGPGGQHRNKVETAVVLHHRPTGVSAEANEKRSQAENRKEATFRLRVQLALKIRCEREKISALLESRIQNSRISINPRHDDFPNVLAEVLDLVHACQFQIPEAAEALQVTGSQLLKFLKTCPPAFEYFNQERQNRNLHRIKF